MPDQIAAVLALAFASLVTFLVFFLNVRGQRPVLRHRWEGKAVVRVPLDSPVTVEIATDAVNWWIQRGAPLYPVVMSGGPPVAARGEIIITWRDGIVDSIHAGYTKRTVSGATGTILYAVVMIPKTSAMTMLLRHELGHAIGFEHVSGHHIMARVFDRMTENDRGLAEAMVPKENP